MTRHRCWSDAVEAALLRAVCEDPYDDAPRLVYADYLEEYGGESDALRAEFIRVQIEIFRLRRQGTPAIYYPSEPNAPEALTRLVKRERGLINLPMEPQSAAFAWSQPIHSTGVALGRPWFETFTFRRGFLSKVSVRARHYQSGALDGVFERHPVTEVVLTDREPVVHNHPDGRGWFTPAQDVFRTDPLPHPHWLPTGVTPRGGKHLTLSTRHTYFPSRERAVAALSTELVRILRERAGLPGLRSVVK